MSEENAEIVRRDVEEVWNGANTEVIEDLVTDDFVYHNPMVEEPIRGPDGYRRLIEEYRGAVPDFEMTIEEMFADDGSVATRFTTRGTPEGTLHGHQTNGRPIEITGIIVDHVENGKLVERWINDDALGMLKQIGAISEDA